jgi:MFS family permease
MILVAGLLIGCLFVIAEKRAVDPIIRISMFTEDPVFTMSNIAAMLNYGATFAIGYILSLYLQQISGFSSQTAGLILVAQPVVMALLSPKMGKLADRIEPWKLATGGMMVITTGTLVLTQLSETTSFVFIIIILAFLGVGFAMFTSPNTKAIMSRVDPKDYGVANSITATMRNLGQSTSMAIVTIAMGIFLGGSTLQNADKATLLHSMKVSFIVFVVLSIIATLMSMKRGSEIKHEESETQ